MYNKFVSLSIAVNVNQLTRPQWAALVHLSDLTNVPNRDARDAPSGRGWRTIKPMQCDYAGNPSRIARPPVYSPSSLGAKVALLDLPMLVRTMPSADTHARQRQRSDIQTLTQPPAFVTSYVDQLAKLPASTAASARISTYINWTNPALFPVGTYDVLLLFCHQSPLPDALLPGTC